MYYSDNPISWAILFVASIIGFICFAKAVFAAEDERYGGDKW